MEILTLFAAHLQMPCEHRTFVYVSLSCHSMMQTPCKIVQGDEEEEKNTIKIGPYGCVNAIKFERLFCLVSIFHFLFLFISYVFCTCLDDKLNIHWSLLAFANFQTGNKICLKCSFLILVFFHAFRSFGETTYCSTIWMLR